jgi:hypothetical protein
VSKNPKTTFSLVPCMALRITWVSAATLAETTESPCLPPRPTAQLWPSHGQAPRKRPRRRSPPSALPRTGRPADSRPDGLNDHKDGDNARLRKRAASVLKKLDALWSKNNPAEVRPGVKLLVQDVEPSIDYAAHQLDHRSRDDRLLASMIQFRDSHSATPLTLMADDFGLRVKAKTARDSCHMPSRRAKARRRNRPERKANQRTGTRGP